MGTKYSALKFMGGFFKGLAILIIVVSLAAVILSVLLSSRNLGSNLAASLSAALSGILLFASGELIHLLLDMELHGRRTAQHVETIAKSSERTAKALEEIVRRQRPASNIQKLPHKSPPEQAT